MDTCGWVQAHCLGVHGWPPLWTVSLTVPSNWICWDVANCAIFTRLLDSALLIEVYPLSCGSSGTVARYLSSKYLNVSTVHPVLFLIHAGNILNSVGPLTPKLAFLTVWKYFQPLKLIIGTM